ncbi:MULTISPECIES: hypothetical protein [Halomonadaceae]|uniref:hypothetical protein n=1 Tax=Halomonadaceae TaxID=28256 RepID=UPI001584017C|nr:MULTISPECIES: hypothetical protein [Halomonas]MDI4636701.1 hypothetical protein [Halomonas sp. BMC7]NUJ61066.1 hypothetical protein [Halomonas taeanensis]
MKRNPLPPTYARQEKTGGEYNQHLTQSVMVVPDHYHDFSETSLREKIETRKRFLQETYSFISDPQFTSGDDLPLVNSEEKTEEKFQAEYHDSLSNIRNGQSATKRQEVVKGALCGNVEAELQDIFSTAFMWVVCADLLEEEGLNEKSWSCLVEFASLEHRLELSCMAEHERREKSIHQKNGAQANSHHANLKEYLIEFLYTEAPENGWRAVKKAAHTLAPPIWHRHEKSEHRAVHETSEKKIETLITNWMNNDKSAHQAFVSNKNRRG